MQNGGKTHEKNYQKKDNFARTYFNAIVAAMCNFVCRC